MLQLSCKELSPLLDFTLSSRLCRVLGVPARREERTSHWAANDKCKRKRDELMAANVHDTAGIMSDWPNHSTGIHFLGATGRALRR